MQSHLKQQLEMVKERNEEYTQAQHTKAQNDKALRTYTKMERLAREEKARDQATKKKSDNIT